MYLIPFLLNFQSIKSGLKSPRHSRTCLLKVLLKNVILKFYDEFCNFTHFVLPRQFHVALLSFDKLFIVDISNARGFITWIYIFSNFVSFNIRFGPNQTLSRAATWFCYKPQLFDKFNKLCSITTSLAAPFFGSYSRWPSSIVSTEIFKNNSWVVLPSCVHDDPAPSSHRIYGSMISFSRLSWSCRIPEFWNSVVPLRCNQHYSSRVFSLVPVGALFFLRRWRHWYWYASSFENWEMRKSSRCLMNKGLQGSKVFFGRSRPSFQFFLQA